jgi:hypothetical protein
MHLENGKISGNCAHAQKGTNSNVMVASRHTVFDPMATPVPEIVDGSLYDIL